MKSKSLTVLIILLIILSLTVIYIFIGRNNLKNNDLDKTMQITVNIYDKEGKEIYNNKFNTDKEYLSEALKDIDAIEIQTEEGDYGEYIISLLGIKQGDDYYWSYYINGEYANTGISNCKVTNESEYSFKIEKFEY